MTTMYNNIYDILKSINYKGSTLHVERTRHINMDNWVLVDRQNLRVKAGNNKSLTCKWLVPYKITKAIGCYHYPLEVPECT